MLSSKSYCFTFSVQINSLSRLIFACSLKQELRYIFFHMVFQFIQHHLLQRPWFPCFIEVFVTFVIKHVIVYIQVCFWTLFISIYFISLVSIFSILCSIQKSRSSLYFLLVNIQLRRHFLPTASPREFSFLLYVCV